MTTAKTFISKCLLAIALAGTALGAIAGPTSFRVDVNTTTLTGNGFLSLAFSNLGAAGPVTAQVSNVTGLVTGSSTTGNVDAVSPGVFAIGNGPGPDNFLDLEATFGGMFSFDVTFTGAFMDEVGIDTSNLFVYLFDSNFNSLAGDANFGVANFLVQPGVGIVTSAQFPAFAAITAIDATAVPEPSSMLMMMTGLGLVGFTARRRKSRAEEAATA
jgi:hypothetical protein